MTIDTSQFHQTFFDECFEGLDVMEDVLLKVNIDEPDIEAVNALFRAAHSIKGGSATFGFSVIANFTHTVEALLEAIRSGDIAISQQNVELLLQSIDVLRNLLSTARNGAEVDKDFGAELQQALEAELSTSGSGQNGVKGDHVAAGTLSGCRIRFEPDPTLLQLGNDVLPIFRELRGLGDLIIKADLNRLPGLSELNPELMLLCWDLELHNPVEQGQIKEVFEWVEAGSKLEIEPLELKSTKSGSEAGNPRAPQASASAGATGVAKESSTIRVSISKIDTLINMVGELVITQSMLSQVGEEFEMSRLEKLKEGLVQLERNTRELQENVMRIRMLHIGCVFNRFPRLVRDLGQKLGKHVELSITGETTEVDKTVLERIGDPLVHLVRNALDHGLETPEERAAAGKPAEGVLSLSACHRGGNIVIEVSDDGRGLRRERLLSRAIERGLVTEGERLTDEQVFDLMFQPGFSTAETVSDVSGRGVGLDVVKRNIKELGGGVDVKSEEGQGTSFIIRLPLTLAILDGQLARVGENIYVIPLVSIVESIQVKGERVKRVAGQGEVYELRGEYVPIVRLYDLFGVTADRTTLDDGLLVVVEADGQLIGLFVDELLGQQQVVIKSLEENYGRIDGISGATILGDGTVALIVDAGGLASMRSLANQRQAHVA